MIPGALKVPLTLNTANETHEQLESFRECNLFVRPKKVRGIYVVRSDHAAEHTNFNLSAWHCGFRSGKLAGLLRPRLPNAVGARGVPFTNCFFTGDEFWSTLQPRTACDVIQVVVVIQGYGNRPGNLERIRSARRIFVVVRRLYQLPGREQRESKWQGRSGGQRPGQKRTPRASRFFS